MMLKIRGTLVGDIVGIELGSKDGMMEGYWVGLVEGVFKSNELYQIQQTLIRKVMMNQAEKKILKDWF